MKAFVWRQVYLFSFEINHAQRGAFLSSGSNSHKYIEPGLGFGLNRALVVDVSNMSKTNEPDCDTRCCASCGIAEVDDVKLMRCTACYLVRYCSVICQRNHRPQHKRACKRHAAELRDELLFRQPESSHIGDCPICMLPLLLGSNI